MRSRNLVKGFLGRKDKLLLAFSALSFFFFWMSCVGEFVDFQKRLLEDFYFAVFRIFFFTDSAAATFFIAEISKSR